MITDSTRKTILAIRANLRASSGRSWCVREPRTSGIMPNGKCYSIYITAYRKGRQVDFMTEEERQELADLLGLAKVGYYGLTLAYDQATYDEYIARSAGQYQPAQKGQ